MLNSEGLILSNKVCVCDKGAGSRKAKLRTEIISKCGLVSAVKALCSPASSPWNSSDWIILSFLKYPIICGRKYPVRGPDLSFLHCFRASSSVSGDVM